MPLSLPIFNLCWDLDQCENGGNSSNVGRNAYFSNRSFRNKRETIRQLFAHNDWEFNNVPTGENITCSQALQEAEESDPHFEENVLNNNQKAKGCQHCVAPVLHSRQTDNFGD